MTRKEQILAAAQEHRELFWNNESKEGRVAKASFIEGAEYADSHPRLVPITYEAIDKAAKEFISTQWSKQMDTLSSAIEEQYLHNFIEKAAEWLRGRLPLTNLDEFINEFKKEMK